ncbi:hypothetical protein HaLaN_29104 [Haematococcus lacustris]|uniref:Uncharacterized protein n=1 Tax=Haematococcus lacustris TaxID=44745 RepID=A0A6A0ACI6_HAELA|nr:hypothetical protein HaLaN_29104 [Haematococcus lacustris]
MPVLQLLLRSPSATGGAAAPGPDRGLRQGGQGAGSRAQGAVAVVSRVQHQVIKVPEGAVLRGCKKTRRKLRDQWSSGHGSG